MDFDPEDQEVIRLLNKIKDIEGEYPEQMFVARRHSYLKQMGEISLGISADLGAKNTATDIKHLNISPTTSTFVETALVIAIIAEATTVAYFYRDRLAEFFHRTLLEPRVQEVTPPPVFPTVLETQEMTPSPATHTAIPSAMVGAFSDPTGATVTLTGTPMPGASNNSIDTVIPVTSGEPNLLNVTPGPNSSGGNNTNNGHHYGQTPKPERTKENGNNPAPKEDKPPKENEEKPPKDNNDKPPKDKKDKPPKN